MMRAIRFASQLQFELDPSDLEAIKANAARLISSRENELAMS